MTWGKCKTCKGKGAHRQACEKGCIFCGGSGCAIKCFDCHGGGQAPGRVGPRPAKAKRKRPVQEKLRGI